MNNLLRAILITNNPNYEFILITDDIQSLYRLTTDPIYLLIFYKKHLLVSIPFGCSSLNELFSINKNIKVWSATRTRLKFFTVYGVHYLRLKKIIILNIKYVYKTSEYRSTKFALCRLKLDIPLFSRILRQNVPIYGIPADPLSLCIYKLSYTSRPDTVL